MTHPTGQGQKKSWLYNAYCVAGELKDGTFVKSYNIYPRLEMTLLDDRLGDELTFLLKVGVLSKLSIAISALPMAK
jgi:hypothetical protein